MTTSNGALPSTVRFGFAGSTGGSINNHDLTCFIAEPVTANSGAGADTVQAGQVRTDTRVYTASYDPNFWTGSLISSPISSTSTGLVVSTPTWDGSCVLIGGGCSTTGVAVSSAQGSASRTLVTLNSTAGAPFTWSNLTTVQEAILNSSDSAGQDRLNWLRCARDKEHSASPPGNLRARASVLGDIVDSSPTWIGPPTMPYGSMFTDKLYSSAGSEGNYTTFASNLSQRLNVVYTGGNDGILHGFEAGANDSSGNYSSTLNDGKEVAGIVPSSALAYSDIVDLTKSTYNHNYFSDASPGFGDLYYGGACHTWLVRGIGSDGQEILVADITDPQGKATGTTSFAESNAANIFPNDITPVPLTAATCVNATTNFGDNLGNTYGTPLVRRLHNGKWAIIFGNDYGSTSKHAGVHIGLVNSSTGALSYYWLGTPYTSGQTNGIAYVSSADLDGDHVTDYFYAGDLLGNVWRFDLTSSNPADWAAFKFGQPNASPLFKTPSAQPITTQLVPTITLSAGIERVLLGFGTGKSVPFDGSTPATYASGTQSIYGIWDWDMTTWNTGATTANSVTVPASSSKLGSLSQVATSPYRTFTASNLLENSVASTIAASSSTDVPRATTTIRTVRWVGSIACTPSNTNTQYGWKFDLPYSGEQLVYSPVFQGGVLFANTTIPPAGATAGAWTPSQSTGWSRGLDMASGGGLKQNLFPDSAGSLSVTSGSYSITTVQLNAVGKPYIISVGSKLYGVSQTVGGKQTITRFNPQGSVTVKRVSWQQLR